MGHASGETAHRTEVSEGSPVHGATQRAAGCLRRADKAADRWLHAVLGLAVVGIETVTPPVRGATALLDTSLTSSSREPATPEVAPLAPALLICIYNREDYSLLRYRLCARRATRDAHASRSLIPKS